MANARIVERADCRFARGAEVEIREEGIRPWRGVVTFVSPHAEAGSQTLKVNAEVDNAGNVLKTGTFATMVIYPDRQPAQARN